MMEQTMAERNRKLASKQKEPQAPLRITYPNAAGIDIGSASHFVAVPPDRDDYPVREFPSFTADLHALADWLSSCGVDTVAMESTGVYWIPLFEVLEARGFTVFLVNARHVKNVSGRKSDVLDCQWLQQLMSYGLLAGAFRPPEPVCVLRALWRQRAMLLRGQARQVQHIQKALTQMNIQLANVISDVVGVTGQLILRAILSGERDGKGWLHSEMAASKPAPMTSPAACKGTGAPSICSPCAKPWKCSISSVPNWRSATAKSTCNFKCCKRTILPAKKASDQDRKMRPPSICVPACIRCAGSI